MKIGLINDTHFGARNDSKVFDDYFYEFYDQVFFPYLQRNNIKTVVHLGDIVDRRKFINYKILRNFKTKFIKRFSDMGIDFHVIIGNHDTFFKNTNEINSMTELFDNGETNQISIYTEPEEILFDGTKVLMLPWINDGNRKESLRLLEESNAEIILGHLEVKGFAMMLTGGINEHGLEASAFNRFDMAMTGHFHHKSDDGTVYYLGAPYEMTWADYQDPRGFHIFDTETRELEHIINPFKMFHKIVYDDLDRTLQETVHERDYSRYTGKHVKVVVQSKTNPYWFDLMLDEIYNANPFHVSIVEDFLGEVNADDDDVAVDQAEDTLTILRKYVDDIGVEDDKKNELNELLHGLYLEAISMETE